MRSEHVVCGQVMETVHHVPDLQPREAGPWRSEAEKIAWTDPATGLACIARRDLGGYLWGFVGIEQGHPLYGFDASAIPRTVIQVHGGLVYSERCARDGAEELSICHAAVDDAVRDARWWLGFACYGVSDFIPGLPAHAVKARSLGIEQIYRDETYVYNQCASLAAQLAALTTVPSGRDRVTPPRDSGDRLPWGSWARTATSSLGIVIVDGDGGHWSSIRELFWAKRLGMRRCDASARDEQLELMLAALASLERRTVPVRESIPDVFDNVVFSRFYVDWLGSVGLVGSGGAGDPAAVRVTDEGAAVLRMLLATRPREMLADRWVARRWRPSVRLETAVAAIARDMRRPWGGTG